jgi:PHD/YefM family antitoxin component YafN of YafNO toxin-antitoxin module
LLETAELLSVPGLKESIKKADKEIKKGDVKSFKEIFG